MLVVDNSHENLDFARAALEPTGHGVITALSVDAALEIAHSTPSDLILSDIHLPKRTGFDLLAEVKGDPALRAIPFVFLTSTIGPTATRSALGADRFLHRPIEPPALIAAVDAFLGATARS